MTQREVLALLTFGLVAVGALSARAVKLSGGRRRAMKADAREARLREAEAFAAQAASPPAPEHQRSKRGADPREYAAPWMDSLKKALNHGGTQRSKRDRSEAKRKQVQLATVDPASGRPAVRTIVFRGFLASELASSDAAPKPKNGESCLLTFITDSRAEKVRHVSSAESGRAPVELCWWLDEAGVQFRISGDAVLASSTSEDPRLRAACEAVWERLGESTRSTFTWPHPGEQVSPSNVTRPGGDGGDGGGGGGGVSLSEAHFRLVVVVPHRVDELRLGGKQKRTLYTLKDEAPGAGEGPLALLGTEWNVEDVNP